MVRAFCFASRAIISNTQGTICGVEAAASNKGSSRQALCRPINIVILIRLLTFALSVLLSNLLAEKLATLMGALHEFH
jgi:hypothetical protein